MNSYQYSTTFHAGSVAGGTRIPHSSADEWRNSLAWPSVTRLATLAVAAMIVLSVMLLAIDLTMGYTVVTPGSEVVGPGAGLGL